jgi:hypothetical protein
VAFSLQVEGREKIIQNLRSRTQDLQILLQSSELLQVGAAKKASWKGSDFRDIRIQARNLYELLRHSWRCACSTHVACLRLQNHDKVGPYAPLRFLVRLCLVDPPPESNFWAGWYDAELEEIPDNQFLPKPHSNVSNSNGGESTSPLPNAESKSFQAKKIRKALDAVRKKVQFIHVSDKIPLTVPAEPSSGKTGDDNLILENLCDILKATRPTSVLVHSSGQRHRLIHLGTKAGSQGYWISLQALLEKGSPLIRENTMAPPFFRRSGEISRCYRRKIALILASSVLQLHETGWLSEAWRPHDILFSADSKAIEVEFPFLSKAFPLPERAVMVRQAAECDPYETRREVLLALAMVLIQLCYNSPWANLQQPDDIAHGDNGQILSNRNTAVRVVNRIWAEEGERYQAVIQFCIAWGEIEEDKMIGDDAFQRGVFENVLIPLQEDMANFGTKLFEIH